MSRGVAMVVMKEGNRSWENVEAALRSHELFCWGRFVDVRFQGFDFWSTNFYILLVRLGDAYGVA